jgi:phosphotransferase system enzyme I (PtsI)
VPELLQGIGVSPGLAAGPVMVMGPVPVLPAARQVTDLEDEIAVAENALKTVEADLRTRADGTATGAGREVLQAQAMLASDPVLLDDVIARIQHGDDALRALRNTFDKHRELLSSVGGHFAERVADLDDIAHRALAAALGQPMPGVPAPGHPFILVADDLSPADTASLDPAVVLALVTERGGPTSHTAILARSLGLPAVVGCGGVLAAADSVLATVDGTTGQVRLGVQEDEVAGCRARAIAQLESLAAGRGPGRTADGHAVDLMLNIGSAADLTGVDLTDVGGVGLFRTEFLFLDRHEEPGLDEQVLAYAEVFDAFDHGTVVVRTLDAGADKPLPFLGLPDEPNPALGMRGLRVARRRPDILDTQLRAIARAAARTRVDVWVMAPMVSTAKEAAEFVERAHAHGLPTAGVMIEVPAAALLADRFLRIVDFLSIGTNDLSQYTLAADRQTGDLADLLDPWQPALLQLIERCAAAGKASGKPVGVCGEAAADPLLAPVLVGLGISKLSMAAPGLPAVRAQLAQHSLAVCGRLARRALDSDDAASARAAARAD